MSRPLHPETQSDEVSLREVYFVLLRGLPIILGLALLAGLGAYFLGARQRPVYNAQSTVMVTPPAIAIEGGDTLTFNPPNEISFQSYSTLARSQEVLKNAVSLLPDAQISPNQLLSLSTLREVAATPPTAAGTIPPLSVIHTVKNANPERAAALADAWAESTLAAVRRSLFASLELVGTQTAQEAERLQKDVAAVETRVQAFAAQDQGTLLEAELTGLTRQLTDGRARQSDLGAEIAASRARVAALQKQLGGAQTSGPVSSSPELFGVLSAVQAVRAAADPRPTSPNFAPPATLTASAQQTIDASDVLAELPEDNQDALVDFADTLYSKTLDTLETDLASYQRTSRYEARAQAQGVLDLALLSYASAQSAQGGAGGDALTLLSQAELQREQVTLEGLIAEQQRLGASLPGYTQGVATLQRQIASLDQRRDSLDRELERALSAYDTVTQLQANVSYLTNLAPTNARILSQASIPTTPTGLRSGFNTAVAALIGGLLGLVFVFLQAAIRRPATRKATA